MIHTKKDSVTKRWNSKLRYSRRGFTIFLLFIVITIASILGMSLYRIISDISYGTAKHCESIKTYYLAEAGMHKALWDLKTTLGQRLVTPRRPVEGQVQQVNEGLLALMDIERARRWNSSYTFEDDDLAKGAKIRIYMELLDVSATPFFSYLDPLDKVPPYLDPYHLKRHMEEDRQLGINPLGGWRGKLRVAVTATYRRTSRTIETWRSIHMVDVTPPGADYTLFVLGKEREYLKAGRFILSNLSIPGPVKSEILRLAHSVNDVLRLDIEKKGDKPESMNSVKRLNSKMDELMRKDSVSEALKLVHELSKAASDRSIDFK